MHYLRRVRCEKCTVALTPPPLTTDGNTLLWYHVVSLLWQLPMLVTTTSIEAWRSRREGEEREGEGVLQKELFKNIGGILKGKWYCLLFVVGEGGPLFTRGLFAFQVNFFLFSR